MIVEYIRYRVDEQHRGGFEEAYAKAAGLLAAAPQCLGYELSRCVDDSSGYILRIEWVSAQEHLGGFRKGPHFGEFFGHIRAYVEDIEEMRHYEVTAVAGAGGAGPPTLFEWAGGSAALARLFDVFYRRVPDDELLAPVFAGMDPHHAEHVATWLGEVFGGPADYTARRGGYPHMLGRHLGRAITEAQRRRWVALLQDAADEVGLPADPEFRAAFVGYLEWGSRLAVENSQPDADPVRRAPVPRWGWGVAPPYEAGT